MRASVATLFLFLLSGSAWPQSAVNPLKGDLQVHDPVVIKAGATWFVFHTGNGISVKTSGDRVTWKNAGRVFAASPAWHKQYVPKATVSLWAPDIHYRDGRYWLYYSVSSFGSRISAIGLATADTLLPEPGATHWIDQGMVLRTGDSENYNAIDPNAILDAEGSACLAFGSWWSGIKLVALDRASGKPAVGSAPASIASHDGGIEGAFLLRQGPYFHLFVSFDHCCQGAASDYNIRAGRASRVAGPYLDSQGKPMLQGGGDLLDRGDARWKGPGHNGVFVDYDTVFLVNHAYDAENAGRSTLWIRPLYWTLDGWPTLDSSRGTTVAVLAAFKPQARPERAKAGVDFLGRVAGGHGELHYIFPTHPE